MSYKTGSWGIQAQKRSNRRTTYFRGYARKWYREHREVAKERANKWYRENKERAKARIGKYGPLWRYEVLLKLGSKCCRCGFSDERALQIDHINGGGTKERSHHLFGPSYYRRVFDSILKNEGKFQLLCANCNWI